MNRVYSVEVHEQYEGGRVEGIYGDPEDAEDYARELVGERLSGSSKTEDDVREWRDASEGHVVSHQLGSTTWMVKEYRVQ